MTAKASLQGVRRGLQAELEPPGTSQSLFLEEDQRGEGGCCHRSELVRLMQQFPESESVKLMNPP